MGRFFSCLGKYDLFTSLLPGVMLAWYLMAIHKLPLILDADWLIRILTFLGISYFLGLVGNRIGALLGKVLCVHVDYQDYLKAGAQDDKIAVLTLKRNMYRTLTGICLMALASDFLFVTVDSDVAYFAWRVGFIELAGVLFAWSCHTQSQFVAKRIEVQKGKGDSLET